MSVAGAWQVRSLRQGRPAEPMGFLPPFLPVPPLGGGAKLTCAANIHSTNKTNKDIVEVTLNASPHAVDERVVTDPYYTFTLYLACNRKSNSLHNITEQLPDGAYRTRCGITVRPQDVDLYESTKPYIGYVHPITHELVPPSTHDQCQRCIAAY